MSGTGPSAAPESPKPEPTKSDGSKTSAVSRVLKFLNDGRQIALALGGLLIAIFALWALVKPHFSHHAPPLQISVTCSLSQHSLMPGMTVALTYHIDLNEVIDAGLGAGLYDNQGNDYSTGYGDRDDVQLASGRSAVGRPFLVPGNLPPGMYEVDAEIWPPNQIGANVNDLADAVCAYFNVP